MEEVKNFTQDDVLDVIKDFPIQPLRNRLIITVNVEEPDGNLVLSENDLSDIQYVIAVGDHVHGIKPGQKVILDLEKMVKKIPVEDNSYETRTVIQLDPIEVDGKIYAFIYDTAIKANDNR